MRYYGYYRRDWMAAPDYDPIVEAENHHDAVLKIAAKINANSTYAVLKVWDYTHELPDYNPPVQVRSV